jgi:ribosomal protein L37AE/L43A
MAVFRITSRTKRIALAKRSLRYIVHRRSQEQSPITRTLYGEFGQTTKHHAYEAMDRAGKRTTFFRTVISPDPATEDANRDLDLRLLTDATMQRLKFRLQGRPFEYFAAIHTDHSNNRHIHVILLLEKDRLAKTDLKALRQAATANAKEQRRLLDQGQERVEEVQAQAFGKSAKTAQVIFRSQSLRHLAGEERTLKSSGGVPRQNPTCSSCGPHAQMHRLTKTLFHCPTCGKIVKDAGIGMEIVRQPTLELSLGLEVGGI